MSGESNNMPPTLALWYVNVAETSTLLRGEMGSQSKNVYHFYHDFGTRSSIFQKLRNCSFNNLFRFPYVIDCLFSISCMWQSKRINKKRTSDAVERNTPLLIDTEDKVKCAKFPFVRESLLYSGIQVSIFFLFNNSS